MSKAPHPNTPLRLVGADRPLVERLSPEKVRELFPKWPGLDVVMVRTLSADPQASKTFDELLAEAQREDTQARLRFTRSWRATVWVWMWGES